VATALRADVGPAAWRNGLACLVGVALQDHAMVVGAPSRFHLDRTNRRDDFKRRYRQCDLLLVDDVQFLEGKEGTQEEFFHTFNDVTEHGGRLVLTAARDPIEIGRLPDRLRTRFRSGLVANLSAPEVETRRQIVAKKAALSGVELPAEVIDLIAAAVTTSVRELEGGLNQVVALASLQRSPATIEVSREALGGFLGTRGQIITLDRIIDEPPDSLASPHRSCAVPAGPAPWSPPATSPCTCVAS
jgi:chromosomal replication initiation ATPase DnaA